MSRSAKAVRAIGATSLALMLTACGSDGSGGGGANAADAAYARSVTQHHAQTLQLINLPSIHTLPTAVWAWTDPVRTQQLAELTRAVRLLRGWHESIPETGLRHIDEGSQPRFDTSIPGVLTPQQVDSLANLRGSRLQRAWLQLFITHEQGAIRLAQREVAGGQEPVTVDSAQQDVQRHRRLLAKLRRLLASAKPLPPR